MSAINRGFDAAFAACELSDAPRTARKMGAALFSGSRLLSIGANLYRRSHPKSHAICTSTHCEHVALLKRQHYTINGAMTLFVARRIADGSAGNSRPCPNCIELCRLAGVTRIWFYEYGVQKMLAPLCYNNQTSKET